MSATAFRARCPFHLSAGWHFSVSFVFRGNNANLCFVCYSYRFCIKRGVHGATIARASTSVESIYLCVCFIFKLSFGRKWMTKYYLWECSFHECQKSYFVILPHVCLYGVHFGHSVVVMSASDVRKGCLISNIANWSKLLWHHLMRWCWLVHCEWITADVTISGHWLDSVCF